MISVIILTFYFYRIPLNLNLLRIRDNRNTTWGRADLKDVDDSNLGLKGSPTQIARASDKVRKGQGEKVTLDPSESVTYIMDKLKEKHVI